jgi:hypothetical protein
MTRRKKPEELKGQWGWARKKSFLPGGIPIKRYEFSTHLKKVGDFVETHVIPTYEERFKIMKAAHWWAWAHNRVVQCRTVWAGGGKGLRITLMRMYR